MSLAFIHGYSYFIFTITHSFYIIRPNLFAESREKSEELSMERQRLEREMEKLNSEIAEEEAKREEQRVRFVEGIKAQVEEKEKREEEEGGARAALMSREDFLRQTNEMAQRLQNWDWNSAPEIGVSM